MAGCVRRCFLDEKRNLLPTFLGVIENIFARACLRAQGSGFLFLSLSTYFFLFLPLSLIVRGRTRTTREPHGGRTGAKQGPRVGPHGGRTGAARPHEPSGAQSSDMSQCCVGALLNPTRIGSSGATGIALGDARRSQERLQCR